MTVIAAVARDGHIVMAADTATNYADTAIFGARKIRLLDRVLLAACGHGAIPAVLQRHMHIDDVPTDPNGHDVQAWADAIASSATEILANQTPPLLHDEPDGSRTIDGSLLLGWGGHLFYLFTHQAQHVDDGIAALGSGSDVALGVLHATLSAGDAPDKAVLAAVDLACHLNPFCRVDAAGPQLERLPG